MHPTPAENDRDGSDDYVPEPGDDERGAYDVAVGEGVAERSGSSGAVGQRTVAAAPASTVPVSLSNCFGAPAPIEPDANLESGGESLALGARLFLTKVGS